MIKTPLKIALIYENSKVYLESSNYTPQECAHLEVGAAAPDISSALSNLGHTVILIPDIHTLVQRLAAGESKAWDLAFNITEGVRGLAREAQVPALLEAFGVLFTFSNAAGMVACLDKGRAKMILEHHRVPTAPFAVLETVDQDQGDIQALTLSDIAHTMKTTKHASSLSQFPLFVKPLAEGSSQGITSQNKVQNLEELAAVANTLRRSSPSSPGVLVETFLPGREFTVGILGTGSDARVLGVTEYTWSEGKAEAVPFTTARSKKADEWAGLVEEKDCGIGKGDGEVEGACEVSLRAWKALRCRDAGRVDVRIDGMGIANVMEVNPLAGLKPGWSQLPILAECNGVSFQAMVEGIVESALKRRV